LNGLDIQASIEAALSVSPVYHAGDREFGLHVRLGAGFLALSTARMPAWIVGLGTRIPAYSLLMEGLAVMVREEVRFEASGKSWQSPAVIFECRDLRFLRSFCVFVADLHRRLPPDRPNWNVVKAALAEWERFFCKETPLTPQKQLGLWGELSLIYAAQDKDLAVAAWVADSEGERDFAARSVRIECKTSTRRLHHHVSVRQVADRPNIGLAFLVSLWVGENAGDGRTLSELVAPIRASLSDDVEFDRKLGIAGYFDADAKAYVKRFSLLSEPMWFPLDCVPQVRTVDPGISQIRYLVDLPEECILSSIEAKAIFDSAFGRV
jgi:putative PD-(D/E)XK family protein DUF4420